MDLVSEMIFSMVGLGSSSLFPSQRVEGLCLSLSAPRLAGISTTGEGISWDSGSSATSSAHCVTVGSWRYHSLKNASPRSLFLLLFPAIVVCTSDDTVKGYFPAK